MLSKGDVKSQKLRVEFSLEDMDTDGTQKPSRSGTSKTDDVKSTADASVTENDDDSEDKDADLSIDIANDTSDDEDSEESDDS